MIFYLETEDITHLDFAVSLTTPGAIASMHGLLGQSLHWAPGANAVVEGGHDMLYAIDDGTLTGTNFKYNLFGQEAPINNNAPTQRRLKGNALNLDGPLTAGSPAAVHSAVSMATAPAA